jgi:hypothetical protein
MLSNCQFNQRGEGMNRFKAFLKLILIIGTAMTISACSKTVQWEEEVPLNTGEVIWVKRNITYKYETTQDNPFVFQYWPMGNQEIAFEWKGRNYHFQSEKRLILLAVSPIDQLPVLIEPKEWERASDDPCVKPFYTQIVLSESKQEWIALPKVQPWLYNLPRNLMAHRGNLNEVQKRYTSNDRQLEDQTMTIQSPSMARIDPNYQSEVCRK